MKFTETEKVEYDLSSCEATKSEQLTFSLAPRDGARNAMSFTTYKDVKNWEVSRILAPLRVHLCILICE